MAEKRKRRFGDRHDAFRVRDTKGLQTIMTHLMPKRTECEVYLEETFDATELVRWLAEKNAADPENKITLFHCFVTALTRMVRERPLMNRYIQGRHLYERYAVTSAFVAKRRFADDADEALMVLEPKDTDTIFEVAKKIRGDVRETRKAEHAEVGTDSIDGIIDGLAKLPMPLLAFVVKIIKTLDFFGYNPRMITDGDPNYVSIFLSNLGSIKCPSVYHHLNNYGTNSLMVTIGTLHKEEMVMEDGHKEIRDVVTVGATIDERIGDGFYFARSLKLVRYIFAHPELLEKPLGEASGYDYK